MVEEDNEMRCEEWEIEIALNESRKGTNMSRRTGVTGFYF